MNMTIARMVKKFKFNYEVDAIFEDDSELQEYAHRANTRGVAVFFAETNTYSAASTILVLASDDEGALLVTLNKEHGYSVEDVEELTGY